MKKYNNKNNKTETKSKPMDSCYAVAQVINKW